MINSTQQLNATREWIAKFEDSINEVERQKAEGKSDSRDADIAIGQFKYEIAKLQAQIAEYESLNSGSMSCIKPRTLEDLPRTLIQLRIALGWSQLKLADEVGIAQQQIARYETSGYDGVSFQRMLALLDSFGAHIAIEKIKLMFESNVEEKFFIPKGTSIEEVVQKAKKIQEEGFMKIAA